MASIVAPWRKQFLSNISHMETPTFSLSTLALSSPAFSWGHGGPVPRVRTCVFRGMWTDCISNERNKAESNPEAYDSDCLMFTTDARMEKAEHILQVKSGDDTMKSGGGGPVEATFWVPDVKMQWRVCGDAWILGPDVESSAEGAKTAREAVKERMIVIDEGKAAKWSWERELTFVFGAQSPMIRGSFAMPTPGKPVPDGEDWRSIKPVDDLNDPEARQNFRVVVIRPFEVESLELKDPAKRYRYMYQADGSWTMLRLWP